MRHVLCMRCDRVDDTTSDVTTANFPSLESDLLEEDEEAGDKMGDLQSPTYVKKTAHMFNTIYSSTQTSGASPQLHNPQQPPSYVNVSKSVSGYSCLSYSNNNNNNGPSTNGSSNGTALSLNGSSSSPYSHRFVNGSTKQSSAPQPEVLSSGGVESSEAPYVPSHGKSFIMQRIERLYGPDAHTQKTSGVIVKKCVAPSGLGQSATTTTITFESSLHSSSSLGGNRERIIPIEVENGSRIQSSVSKDNSSNGTEPSSTSKSCFGFERCMNESVARDVVDAADTNGHHHHHHKNGNAVKEPLPLVDEDMNAAAIIKHSTTNRMGNGLSIALGVKVDPSPGSHKLETIRLSEKEKKVLISSSSPRHETPVPPLPEGQVDKANGDHTTSSRAELEEQPMAITVTSKAITIPTPTSDDLKKDGHYFLSEMTKTTQELETLIGKVNGELESLDQNSEKAGCIHAAIGKANLLIKKKFKQFSELCNANLEGTKKDEPETTNEDLAGFWDMVMIQVDQVQYLFKDIEEGKFSMNSASGVTLEQKASLSPKKSAASLSKLSQPTMSKSATSAAAKARDESRKKLLAEKRRLMKDQATAAAQGTKDDVVILTPGSENT